MVEALAVVNNTTEVAVAKETEALQISERDREPTRAARHCP